MGASNDDGQGSVLTGGTSDMSPHLDEFTEEDSLRLTAVLALDGHRLKLTRPEKDEVVRLSLARSWSREKASRQLGISLDTFSSWARRAQIEYPVTEPALWWVHGYIRTDRPRRRAALS